VAVFEVTAESGVPRYRQRVQLDGEFYEFSLHFNSRMSAWMMSVADADGVRLVSGVRLVLDTSLFDQFQYIEELFQGILTAFDTTRLQIPPDVDELGLRVIQLYFDASERSAIEGF
jgi:hypothetical protein